MKQKDQNNSDPALIFPCSGASDAGELAVRIARRMMRSGSGKMFCLAAIGGHIQQFIEDAQLVENIIIIDGCSNGCAKKTLSIINVQGYEFDLEALGFKKGNSPATGKNINKVVTHIRTKLK